jgi:hypothetical protein
LNEEEIRTQQKEEMRFFIVAGASCCRPSLVRLAPIQALERKRRDCGSQPSHRLGMKVSLRILAARKRKKTQKGRWIGIFLLRLFFAFLRLKISRSGFHLWPSSTDSSDLNHGFHGCTRIEEDFEQAYFAAATKAKDGGLWKHTMIKARQPL